MNLLEKSIQYAEKYYSSGSKELNEGIATILERYGRFVDKSLKLAEDYEKQGKEKLSNKFYTIAEKYDAYIQEARKKLNYE